MAFTFDNSVLYHQTKTSISFGIGGEWNQNYEGGMSSFGQNLNTVLHVSYLKFSN